MVQLNIRLVDMLEQLRDRLGGSQIIIASGCRCPEYNRAVRGARENQHQYGNAAVKDASPVEVADIAGVLNFQRVGWYANFSYVDVRPGAKARWKD